MNPETWRRAKEIFAQAAELPPGRRTVYVQQVCGADGELCAEVERLLAAAGQSHRLLDQPVLQWQPPEHETFKEAAAGLPFARLGHYRLLRRVGQQSGMGEVYLAQDERPQMNRRAAVKLMQAKLPPEYLARFNDEVQTLAQLNHPNIITLYDSGEAAGQPYFVMEFFEGESLQERLERGLLAPAAVAQLTEQICEALHAAHAQGVIHRDIKPANIMVKQDGERFHVKVLDFGIAILAGVETRTIASDPARRPVVGTAAYLSPEQARGLSRREITGAADIYSLGAVVYQLLTGAMVFEGRTVAEFLHYHCFVPPQPLSARNPALTPALDAVVLKALAKEPSARYPSARAFAQALQQAVAAGAETIPVTLPVPALAPEPEPSVLRKVWLPLAAVVLISLCGWVLWSQFVRPVDKQVNKAVAPTEAKPLAPTPAPPSVPVRPELTAAVFRKGVAEPAPPGYVFRSGEYVRLAVTPARDGYLYLVQHGSDGAVEVLYPSAGLAGSFAPVRAGREIKFPAQGDLYFRFDRRPGVETLYFVFVERQGEAVLADLEQAVVQRRALSPEKQQQVRAALESLAAGSVSSGAVTVRKRELRHE